MHSIKDKDIIDGKTDILKRWKLNNSFVYDGTLLQMVSMMNAYETRVHFRSAYFLSQSTSSFWFFKCSPHTIVISLNHSHSSFSLLLKVGGVIFQFSHFHTLFPFRRSCVIASKWVWGWIVMDLLYLELLVHPLTPPLIARRERDDWMRENGEWREKREEGGDI